jgi:hypothetical protein
MMLNTFFIYPSFLFFRQHLCRFFQTPTPQNLNLFPRELRSAKNLPSLKMAGKVSYEQDKINAKFKAKSVKFPVQKLKYSGIPQKAGKV